ncbi:hypothetical protein LTR37_009437 [Vermiconidia calcicola]|uniref:Uncharacterized protein n=1 Tax=Vermiconidia calcicola TaxID=1690605 RepID=A0ACC3N7J3_9PEZI|nr:hypothetical protein LTR37_009437 [Vermiconidia calcicola]
MADLSELLPEQLPPEQAGPSTQSEVDDDMDDVRVSCWPPLGQSYTVPKGQRKVNFTVLLQTAQAVQAEVCSWHDCTKMLDLKLNPSPEIESTPHFNRSGGPNDATAHYFTASLERLSRHGHTVSFTLRFRTGPDRPWRWMKRLTGVDHGKIHFLATGDFMENTSNYPLSCYFSHTSPDIKIKSEDAETSHTQLYSITCPIAPAKGKDSGYQHHRLGKIKYGEKWFALVRLWSPWLAPRQGSSEKFELDKDGVLLSFLRSDGLHVVCLAISGVQDVLTTFFHDAEGNIEIKGRNDREEEGTGRVLVAAAESFEVANAAVMYHARKIVADYGSSSAELAADTKEIESLTNEVKPEWLEEWYDGLTYCTWNGLGQNLTADKIEHALAELAKNNINITNLIIDDNWQSLASGENQFRRGWSRFEANASGFPDGMKATTAAIRKKFPNVNHIAVWHAILGYWGGIDPDGEIAQNYKTRLVEKESGVAGGSFTVVDPTEAKRMYNDFYAFLSSVGIDSVKTDAQFFLDLLQHAPDRREMMLEYQDAWTLAHLRHFSSRAISCMSQFPQALFHSQLPKNKPRLLVRNSDDFFPQVETSHAWHIFCNAHNSLFTQHLNALPDWDMFQTSHSWASFHAAARCVSGGPIYFTDVPGEHDIELIRQMTAQTTRGRTVILRPQMVGKAMDPYHDYHAQAILKIGTYNGMSGTGTGILGLFNVTSGHTLHEFIHLQDFPGTEQGEYVLGSFVTGQTSQPMHSGREDSHAFVHTELRPKEWDILSAYAVRSFTLHPRGKAQRIEVANMGLLGKLTGAAAVSGCDMYVESNGRLRIWTSLKALGVLGLWVSDLPERTVEGDFMIVMYGKVVPLHCVRKSEKSDDVLEIDVERAWKEMGLEAGWSNEVSVEVFVG